MRGGFGGALVFVVLVGVPAAFAPETLAFEPDAGRAGRAGSPAAREREEAPRAAAGRFGESAISDPRVASQVPQTAVIPAERRFAARSVQALFLALIRGKVRNRWFQAQLGHTSTT
mgnify:CR=1 FL=1